MRIFFFIISTLALFCATAQAQQHQTRTDVLYEFGGDKIVGHYANNETALEQLQKTFGNLKEDSMALIERVVIESYASPEGDKLLNKRLSQRRSEAIVEYLKTNFELHDSLLEVHSNGVGWDRLRVMIQNSKIPHRDELLEIIDTTPEETWRKVNPNDKYMTLVDSRNKHLMDLRGGVPYKYMAEHFFPSLRTNSTVTIYFKRVVPERVVQLSKVPNVLEPQNFEPKTTIPFIQQMEVTEKVPWLAVKTNLLYDLMLIPNIEIEIPIGNQWSVAAEWMFPWWVTKDNGNALEIQGGTIEGRYWFGDRTNRPLLTGWFGGAHLSAGYYDLQRHDNGYQGEYVAAGLIGGFAHTINKKSCLRLEYSLGFGFMQTGYRYYEGWNQNEHLVWQYDGSYSWFGPTKAEVSLVWMLNRKLKKKGGVR